MDAREDPAGPNTPGTGDGGEAAYMAAIMPFRHLIVYPPLMREIGREWREPTYEPRQADAN